MARRTISVKVARVGSRTAEVELNGGRTVQDALDAAELSPKASEDVTVNGDEWDVDSDEELRDGDKVVLVKNIEGGNA